MQVFRDYMGREVRLTDEPLYGHIAVEHPQVLRISEGFELTLANPAMTKIDENDDEVEIYYKQFDRPWIVVAVVHKEDDSFIATSYTTSRRPRVQGREI